MLLKKNVLKSWSAIVPGRRLISAPWAAAGALSLACLCLNLESALADSAFIEPTPGYAAQDTYTGHSLVSFAMGPGGNSLLAWDDGSDSLLLLNSAGGVITNFGAPAGYGGSSVFNGFVNYNADFTRAMVGFTSAGNTNDRIYEVDLTSPVPAWDQVASFAGNGDAIYHGLDVLVAGANGGFGTPNGLWLMNGAGANTHQLLLETGGFAAGIAQDALGGVYMLTNFFDFDTSVSTGQLLYISSSQVAAAVGGQVLQLADISVVADLDGGGGSVDVGPDGRVLYSLNGADGELWLYDPSDDSFELLGTNKDFAFLSTVDAEGTGWFAGAFGTDGVARVNAVPEPASPLLLVLAGAGLAVARRRRVAA